MTDNDNNRKSSKITRPDFFDHPKDCDCEIHQFIKNKNKKGFPIVFYLCPGHYSTWWHCDIPFVPFGRRVFLRASMLFGLFRVKKVRYIDESCDYCKLFGNRGIGVAPHAK